MNKAKYIKYVFVAFLVTGMWGCTSMLEETEPATSVSSEVALNSADAINAIRASMYSTIRASFDLTTENLIGPDALADGTVNRPGSTRFQALTAANGVSGTVHIGSFGGSYDVLLDANILIDGIPDDVPEFDQATRDQYRGEALAIRAWIMHGLSREFGYEPANTGISGSTFDLSAINRNFPTLDLTDAEPLARSTVTEIYNQMLTDLAEAKTLLAANGSSENKFITEAFVDGMLARVHLYAGNWSDASTAAQNAIDNSGLSLVSTAAGIASMFRGPNPEAIWELDVNPNTEAIAGSNINNGLAAYTSDQWVAQIPTQKVIDAYTAGDYRVAGWHGDCIEEQSVGATANGCSTVNSLGVSITKWNGWKGNLADDITYMRVAEMYLIKAEADAKAANNPNAGVAALQALKTARNAGTVPAGALVSITAFEDEILLERMRELTAEGHRFWDLKRLGRDIPSVSGVGIKIRRDSFRILAPFGVNAQNVNPLLVENPGYEVAGN